MICQQCNISEKSESRDLSPANKKGIRRTERGMAQPTHIHRRCTGSQREHKSDKATIYQRTSNHNSRKQKFEPEID